jgi:molybdopterin-guanine dinucleotide biosynthesis protein A
LASSNVENLWGLVVAGGRSKRFGSDKRLACVNGTTLVARAVETLRTVVGARLLLAGGENPPPASECGGATLIADAVVADASVADASRGGGPTAALVGALTHCRGDVLALACDVPLVDPDLLHALIAAMRGSGRIAALRSASGLEPLAACYPASALRPLHAALSESGQSLRNVLASARAVPVIVNDSRTHNVNHPRDLEVVTRRLTTHAS